MPKFRRFIIVWTLCSVALAAVPFWPFYSRKIEVAQAATGQISLNGAGGNGTNSWTNPTNAQGTTDDNVYATAAPGLGATIVGNWGTYGFDSSLPTDAEITKVEIIPQYKVGAVLPLTSGFDVQAVVSGTACPTTAITDTSFPTTDTDFTADVTSCRAWTRADLLDGTFQVRLGARRGILDLTGTTFSVDRIQVRVTYDTPAFTQSAYRFFTNADSTDVGAALAAQDTAFTLSSFRQVFRVRMLVHIADAALPASVDQFKLQFVDKGSGTCAAPSGGTPAAYTDVNGTTSMAFNDNATPTDSSALTANANDPTHSGHTVRNQTYEESNNATNTSGVADGEDAKWDFSIKDNGASARTFCLRLVRSDGTTFGTYSVYPEFTTLGTLAFDIVDNSGVTVASPAVPFSATTLNFNCTSTTGTLGVTSQHPRVLNTTANAQWSLSLAATAGPTGNWSSGGATFDYNDGAGSPAGCADNGDADSLAGQLSVNPSVMTITPQGGCSTSNLTKGSLALFAQGSVDSITLLTAGASAQTNCYWDLTDTALTQTLPQEQATGAYSISFTLTLVAI